MRWISCTFIGRDFLNEIPTKTCLPIVDVIFLLQFDSIWSIKQTFYVYQVDRGLQVTQEPRKITTIQV